MLKRLALIWLCFVALSALFAPIFFSAQADRMDFAHALEAPSAMHPFGTDPLGRDVLCRVLVGSSVSMGVALVAVAIAVALGTALGAAAGYYGGRLDRLAMAFVDIMLCFPTFFLILAVIAVMGSSPAGLMIVIGLTSWMGTARLARAEVMSLRGREFVLAARALGAGDLRILTRHLIPNAAGPVAVNAILGFSAAILTETGLSFLGLGVSPPTASWGNILMDGKATLGVADWLTFFPGMFILLTVLAFNILGEGQGHE